MGGRKEALERYAERGRSDTAYAAARAAGLANKFTAEEHLLGAIFGTAPSIEELKARTPEDMERIWAQEKREEDQRVQSSAAYKETKERIDRAFSELTDRERTVLELSFIRTNGRKTTFREIGSAIDRSRFTAARILRRALKKIFRNPQTQS